MVNSRIRDFALVTVASLLLLSFSISSLIFTLPLLVFSKRYPKKDTDTACVAVMVLAIVKQLIFSNGELMNILTYFFVGNSLFIPFSLILCVMIWVHTKGYKLFDRVVLLSLPASILFVLYVIVYLLNEGVRAEVLVTYKEIYTLLFKELLSIDNALIDSVFDIVVNMILSIIVPLCLSNALVIHFIYEAINNKRSEEFDLKVKSFRVSESFIYIFLLFWSIMLLKHFVPLPYSISIIINNLVFLTTLLYLLQGFSILYYKIREKNESLKSFTLFKILLFLLFLLPGINMILLLGLTLLGVVENWVEIRKQI